MGLWWRKAFPLLMVSHCILLPQPTKQLSDTTSGPKDFCQCVCSCVSSCEYCRRCNDLKKSELNALRLSINKCRTLKRKALVKL